jgi:hypothetical protein
MMAVVEYLDGTLQTDPEQSGVTRLQALAKKYPADEHAYADWINIWYD